MYYQLANNISQDIALMYRDIFLKKTRYIDPKLMDDLEFRIRLHKEICDYIGEYYYRV